MTSVHNIFLEDRDCSSARLNQDADKKPNKIQGNTAAGTGGEPLRRMGQEQLSDQPEPASGSTGLKGANGSSIQNVPSQVMKHVCDTEP